MATEDIAEEAYSEVDELEPQVPKGEKLPLSTKSGLAWQLEDVQIPVDGVGKINNGSQLYE